MRRTTDQILAARMMKIDPDIQRRMIRNATLSLFIYALPVLLMFLTLYLRGSRPWENSQNVGSALSIHHAAADHAHGYGFLLFIVVLGVVEFSLGLYGHEWTRNEKRSILRALLSPSSFSRRSLPGSV